MISKHPDIRLLLIDDEQEYVRVLSKRLSRRGIQASPAYSGHAGIQSLRWNIYDVAVLDLKLGDMDGLEVLKVMRTLAPSLPVIILSGHGSAKAAEQGLAQGAFAYLTKPCAFKELLAEIRQAVEKKRASTSSSADNQA
jgi:DNA-binding response OmpR family regulator